MIAVCPGYAQAGELAPATLLAARLLQGVSLGGSYGSSGAYFSEVAPPGRRGFYSSFTFVTIILGEARRSSPPAGTDAAQAGSRTRDRPDDRRYARVLHLHRVCAGSPGRDRAAAAGVAPSSANQYAIGRGSKFGHHCFQQKVAFSPEKLSHDCLISLNSRESSMSGARCAHVTGFAVPEHHGSAAISTSISG